MHRDLPRISKPIGGLQYMLPLVFVLSLCMVLVGWLLIR